MEAVLYTDKQKAWLRAVLSVFLCLASVGAYCQTDSIRALDDVVVGYKAPAQGVADNGDGSYTVSSVGLRQGMRRLGEADALTAISMLPGIARGSDYGSGVSIHGCDYSNNVYTLDGARIFFPYHFGGIFSTFNTNHISKLTVDGSLGLTARPHGLGGSIRAVTSDRIPDDTGIIANVGLLASSLTLSVPVDGNMAVIASARASYLNMIYGTLLRSDDSRTRYAFEDYNLTLIRRCGTRGLLKASGLYNSDRLRFDDRHYTLATALRWHNALGGISYTYEGTAVRCVNTLSFSMQDTGLGLSMTQFALSLPSSVRQCAVSGEFDVTGRGLSLGYRAEYTGMSPQALSSDGIIVADYAPVKYDMWHLGAGFAKDWHIGCLDLNLTQGLVADICDDYRHMAIEASVSAMYLSVEGHAIRATVDTRTQSMHQVGFSDIGLASNFFIPATRLLPVQRSYGTVVDYRWQADVAPLSVSVRGFWRRMLHSPEYNGDVLDLLTADYDPMRCIMESDGFNAGGDVAVRYDYGHLSGWGGYSLAVCRRRFAGMGDIWVPSATEPLHSFKAMAQWRLSRRVGVSAYFVLASGRRYTPVEAVYIVGGNVLTEYGRPNSANLPMYHRLDLSATVHMPALRVGARRVANYINISLLNAYGHRNIEMQYFTYNDKDHTIKLRQVQSLYRFVPSVSYTVEL